MRCSHLSAWSTPVSGTKVMVCRKGRNSYYTPTFLHIREYCTSDHHEECPFVLGAYRGLKRTRQLYCAGIVRRGNKAVERGVANKGGIQGGVAVSGGKKRTNAAAEEVSALPDLDKVRPLLNAFRESDGLWYWNLGEGTFHVSKSWMTVMGCGREELINRPDDWLSRVHPDDEGMLKLAISEHLEKKSGAFETEYRIIRNESSEFWVRTRGVATRDSKGKAVNITGIATEINRRKQYVMQEYNPLWIDSLTGLPNRELFVKRLADAKRDPFSLFVVDIDDFKSINRRFGKSGGDNLLSQLARRMKRCFRGDDTVAHLGGDQFIILCHSLENRTHSHALFKRIHELALFPFPLGDDEILIKLSVGMSTSDYSIRTRFSMVRFAQEALTQDRSGRLEKQTFSEAGTIRIQC